MSEDRLTWHFENWAYWQEDRKRDKGADYPCRDGSGAVSGSSRDLEALVAHADTRCAQALDAILDSLTPAESCAVFHFHLSAVYRFGREERPELPYQRARTAVRAGLLRRGIE